MMCLGISSSMRDLDRLADGLFLPGGVLHDLLEHREAHLFVNPKLLQIEGQEILQVHHTVGDDLEFAAVQIEQAQDTPLFSISWAFSRVTVSPASAMISPVTGFATGRLNTLPVSRPPMASFLLYL